MRRKTRKGLLLGSLAQQYTYRWCWWVCQLLSLVSGDVCPREWPHLSAPGGGNDHHLSPLCAPNGKPWFPPQAYPAPGWVAVSAWHVSVSLTACVGGPCLAAVLPPRPRVKDFSGPGIVHEPFLVMEAKTSPAPCTSGLSLSHICSQASAAPMSLVLPCMCWSQAGTQHYQPPPITPGSATSALGAAGAISRCSVCLSPCTNHKDLNSRIIHVSLCYGARRAKCASESLRLIWSFLVFCSAQRVFSFSGDAFLSFFWLGLPRCWCPSSCCQWLVACLVHPICIELWRAHLYAMESIMCIMLQHLGQAGPLWLFRLKCLGVNPGASVAVGTHSPVGLET